MDFMQMDLFDFAAMEAVQKAPEAVKVVLRNFLNDGRIAVPITSKQRIEANFNAIRLLKSLDGAERAPERTEQTMLTKFTGWGGLTEVFMENHPHDAELKKLLTREEYQTAKSSILDSFYTPDFLIDFMWNLVRRELGIRTGKVAELGAGIGNFIGLAPMQSGYQFTAVEVDAVAGNIMKKLYPESDIRIASLETVKLPADFDLVIGNVPFGQIAPYDRNYRGWNLHNYFIARALDCLKPDGAAVLLTSSATLDSGTDMFRDVLAEKGGLAKAIRLPNNTFAGTEVVADILVFRKGEPGEAFRHLKSVECSNNSGTIEVNEYFAKHPEMILGTLSATGKMYGRTGTMTVLPTQDVREALNGLNKTADAPVTKQEVVEAKTVDLFGNEMPTQECNVTMYADRTNIPEEEKVPAGCREYSIFSTLDATYQVVDGKGVRQRDKNGNVLTLKETQKVRSFVKIKDALNEVIEAQLDADYTDEMVEERRMHLRLLYQDHVGRYGVLSNKLIHKICVEDPEYLKVAAMENCRKENVTNKAGIKTTRNVYEPGDILSKRTQWPWQEPDHAENVVEAGLMSHAYRNRIDLEYIARITDKDYDTAKAELLSSGEYFYNPVNMEIELKSKYLSGNIKRKIIEAEEHGLARNVEALKSVLPKPLAIEDIDFALGAFWLPVETIQRWIEKDLSAKVEIVYNQEEDVWNIHVDWQNRNLLNQYNVEQMDTVTLLEHILNLKDPVIKNRTYDYERRDYIEVVNKEATLTARQYKNELMNRFHDFVMDDPELSQAVESVYNALFNNHVLQKYDAPAFETYPGAVSIIGGRKFVLRDHQKRAVTRCVQGNTLLAHAVGAGKTAVMVTAAMELIRLKLATKTMIVVQNATLQQFAEFAPKLYPNAAILIATKNDLAKEKRKRFLGRIAAGKWDIIVIAQSSFNMIEDNPDVIRAKYQEELEQMERCQAARQVGMMLNRRQLKNEEKSKRALLRKIDKLEDRHASEEIVYFDQLGIDALFVDEAHEYKRNFFVTKMNRVKGLDNGASQKAFSLNLKINQIREKTGGRNIYLATGTPVTNTLAELWNMTRYVSPETLQEFNVDTFDRFASTFTQTETALEIDAAGRFKMVTRFAKFTNIVELSKMFRSCADVILSEDLKDIPRPPIKGGHPEQINIPRSGQITDFMRYLCDTYKWFEQLDGSEKREYTHIPICIYGLSRKSTIDLRLIAANAADDPHSKLNVCVQNVLEKYRFYDSIKGAQIIFSDLYQLNVNGSTRFDVFREIKRKLVAGGIPESEIAVVNDYKTDKQRQDVFDLVNKGDVRVIMGSTRKLGTGVNIQERLAVAHHLDAPFRPADMEQRDGRIIRQGNTLQEVEVIRYGMEETLDAGMYQILTRKQKFINDGLMGKRRNQTEINDASVDYATFSANISGSPLMKRKVEIETRLRELTSLEYQFRRSIRRNTDLKKELEHAIPQIELDIVTMERLAALPFNAESPEIELNGVRLEGTAEYRVKQLASYLLNKGLYPAITKAKCEHEEQTVELGFAKINGVEITLKAVCPVEDYLVRDDKAGIRYMLEGIVYHNGRIKRGGEITTGSGLVVSLKTLLANQAKYAKEEREALEVSRQRLAQLCATEGHTTFKYADERNALQTELNGILYELNAKDLLHEDKVIEKMPRLCDYLDLGVEVIAEKVEDITDEPEAEEGDPIAKSA